MASSQQQQQQRPRKMIKTRILILSDTHAALAAPASFSEEEGEPKVPFRQPLPSADVLLHCGDLTMNGSLSQHKRALELIDSVDAPVKVVIPGNHDLTLDRAYYDAFPHLHAEWGDRDEEDEQGEKGKEEGKERGKYSDATLERIRDMYDGPDAREKGIRYLEEGTARITLGNGASMSVYASAWQPEFFNWAFGYPRHVDRFNGNDRNDHDDDGPTNPVPDFDPLDDGGGGGVDVMLTHGPPRDILDTTDTGENVGCEHLRRAVGRCRPRLHCFGHIHEGWGAVRKRWDSDRDRERDPDGEDETTVVVPPSPYETQTEERCMYHDATDVVFGQQTLFVNASIMDVSYRPVNAPWLVDVLLPAAEDHDRD